MKRILTAVTFALSVLSTPAVSAVQPEWTWSWSHGEGTLEAYDTTGLAQVVMDCSGPKPGIPTVYSRKSDTLLGEYTDVTVDGVTYSDWLGVVGHKDDLEIDRVLYQMVNAKSAIQFGPYSFGVDKFKSLMEPNGKFDDAVPCLTDSYGFKYRFKQ